VHNKLIDVHKTICKCRFEEIQHESEIYIDREILNVEDGYSMWILHLDHIIITWSFRRVCCGGEFGGAVICHVGLLQREPCGVVDSVVLFKGCFHHDVI
jgi:hypothetical protein